MIELRDALDRIANRVWVEDHLTEIISHSPVASIETKGLHLDPDHLDLDEQRVPPKEINVFVNPSTSDTRGRHRVLMAAAVVVLVGVAAIALTSTDDDQSPSSTAAATVAATTTGPPTTVAPRTETVHLTVTTASIPVTFTAPVDWTVDETWTAYKPNVAVALGFEEIINIYADGCQWVPLDPPVGPTVDDLVAAWPNVPDFNATAAVDVTVDGYSGKQIEFTVPDYTNDDCRDIAPGQARYALWYGPGAAAPGYWAQGANQHILQRILDVDGTRLVVTAEYLPTASPQDRADLEEALATIQIG
jgi:hypothetical protein